MTLNEDNLERHPAGGCDAVRGLLVPYVDGELEPAESRLVESHVVGCSSCLELLESHRHIALELEAAPAERFPDAPAIARRIRLLARRRASRARALWLSAAAAVLCGAAGLMMGTGLMGPELMGPPKRGARVAKVAVEEILGDLEVLESFEAEGIEPTPELVNALLGPETEGDERSGDALEADMFLDVLEEELSPENL